VSNWVEFLPLLLLVVIFWFLVVRPARARQQDFLRTQSALTAGSEVMLASGIFGEIVTIGDETVELRVAPNTVLTVNRQAVARVVTTPVEQTEPGTGSDD
jgi:preprotein translocase subunit YajC